MLIEEVEERCVEKGFLEFPCGERYEVAITPGLRLRSMEAMDALEEALSVPEAPPRPVFCHKSCTAYEIWYTQSRVLP
jgi:hypothetical protein